MQYLSPRHLQGDGDLVGRASEIKAIGANYPSTTS